MDEIMTREEFERKLYEDWDKAGLLEHDAALRAARERLDGERETAGRSKMGRYKRTPGFDEECFWKKVEKAGPDDCWLWRGARTKSNLGYGSFRGTNAHRWLYVRLHGSLPRNVFVMHSCDNVLCVNPSHLSTGSNSDNLLDASKKGRLPNQIPQETIEEIKRRRLAGESATVIAAEFGLNAKYLRKVARVHVCPTCVRSKAYAADLREQRDAAESALAAEREAHEETRKKLEVAEAFGEEMRGYESRLAAAEECLREIAAHDDRCVAVERDYSCECQANLARVFLAGGAKP